MSEHIILLVQAQHNLSSRTYYDFPSEAETMDHIAALYEARLAKENPHAGQVQYRAEDLFRFIDTFKEFVALVYDPKTQQYGPRDTHWIKDRLIAHFSGQQPNQPPQHKKNQHRNNSRRRF